MCFYFCKSDHGNLIGRQETRCGNRTARGGRRCRSDAKVAPRSFVLVIPLLCLLFHEQAEVSFLNYENDASRLFVIREAAGEISRRSTQQRANPISTFFRPPYDVPDKPTSTQRAPFLPDSPQGTRKWLHYNERVSGRPFGSCARNGSLARAPSRSIYPVLSVNLLIYDLP